MQTGSTRPADWPISSGGCCAPSVIRTSGSTKTACACCALLGWRHSSASRSRPQTLAAMRATARNGPLGFCGADRRWSCARWSPRIRPRRAFAILADTGVLEHRPARAGRSAGSAAGQDHRPRPVGRTAWPRSTLPRAIALRAIQLLRLAALLHDIGKPTTFADGHFIGHDVEGARLVETHAHAHRVSVGMRSRQWLSSFATTCSATSGAGAAPPSAVHAPRRTRAGRRCCSTCAGRQHRQRPRPGCRASRRARGARAARAASPARHSPCASSPWTATT